jgi:hypothetical protein
MDEALGYAHRRLVGLVRRHEQFGEDGKPYTGAEVAEVEEAAARWAAIVQALRA